VAVAIVTGASRGIGRGVAIALALSHAGHAVHATGRSILRADLPSSVSRHRCDHLRDEDTAAVFASAGDAGGGVGKQD
jgi:dehydrogenase/reductase SDR family protein 1